MDSNLAIILCVVLYACVALYLFYRDEQSLNIGSTIKLLIKIFLLYQLLTWSLIWDFDSVSASLICIAVGGVLIFWGLEPLLTKKAKVRPGARRGAVALEIPQESKPWLPADAARLTITTTADKAFIDTNIFLEPTYPQLEKVLFPALKKKGKKLIVILKVMAELKKHKNNPDLRERALYALESINRRLKSGLIETLGEEGDNFADNVFLTLFTKLRLQNKLVLLTQDQNLSHDIQNLNHLKSQTGNPVFVFRITSHGTLGQSDGDIEKQQAARAEAKRNANTIFARR